VALFDDILDKLNARYAFVTKSTQP